MPSKKSGCGTADEAEDTSEMIDNYWDNIKTSLNDLQDNANTLNGTCPIDNDEKDALGKILDAIVVFREDCKKFGRNLD